MSSTKDIFLARKKRRSEALASGLTAARPDSEANPLVNEPLSGTHNDLGTLPPSGFMTFPEEMDLQGDRAASIEPQVRVYKQMLSLRHILTVSLATDSSTGCKS